MIPSDERCPSIGRYFDESGQLAGHMCTRRKHAGREHVAAIDGMGPYPEHKDGVVIWDGQAAIDSGKGGYEPFVLMRWTD